MVGRYDAALDRFQINAIINDNDDEEGFQRSIFDAARMGGREISAWPSIVRLNLSSPFFLHKKYKMSQRNVKCVCLH